LTKNILHVDNLSAGYGQVFALREFHCEVKEGEITAFIGSNGAGKTTFLRTLSGLIKAKTGQIKFDSLDITETLINQRVTAGISMVPEGRLIFPNFTVEQNLRIGAISKRAMPHIKEGLENSYELFPKLKQRRKQLGGSLSGGEQQMLALARGLMAKPRLLMLDEPTLGLAPLIANNIFEMVANLKNTGLSIIIVEQDVNRTLEIADYAYVLENGQGILEGPSKNILENPKVRESYLGI
jgi:branched-chain amino acid transport system ATP-binding protein